ncbi:protein-L-isoaspartate(D-aspartate) O-methyltransferase [Pseudochrobactrum asaccharolyticum]|nr:protein-L-isoaspartate(D-aspartate) O-methyltransferase [Pseudochrobactrum asaccharolyticum]
MSSKEGFASFVLRMRSRGLHDQRLFAAIEATPRQHFLNSAYQDFAYSNRVLPLPCGESIEGLDDQARFLSALAIEPGHRVLEIGTGSGFTAAVMARLAARVTTIERYKTLAEAARNQFQAHQIENVVCKHADGRNATAGGPYDRIIVWLSSEAMPRQYLDLLATHGVLITPVGQGDGQQVMCRMAKVGSRFEREDLMTVRYQPFIEGPAAFL